ncbi:MAG TPA: glycosyltransferase [Vitreimonas sp.]|nr:glycosyltransferase [Vitreimonas sp.]
MPGVRVVLDARPLQDPDRAPTTAAYLEGLLSAFDSNPIPGESFAFLLQADLDDPTARFGRLEVVGRRLLPPTRLLRSGALTVDPFLVRGASLGAAWRAEEGGAAGAVYHAAGGSVPIPVLSKVPTVVTLLDLAPWELPAAFQRGAAARFGQRLRAGLMREAAAVLVAGDEVARSARRLLRLRASRLHVIPLAAREAFRAPRRPDEGRAERDRLGLPERYLVYAGRFDARHDLSTLLQALANLAAAGRPAMLPSDVPWPPRILIVGASPDDRAAVARAAAHAGVGDALAYSPRVDLERVAALVAGARAALLPVTSEAAGLPAIEALAAGTPVIASAVGVLPKIVAAAGILVEPGNAGRLAQALATTWADDRVHERLAVEARERSFRERRTWEDVARETRAVYAGVGLWRPGGSAPV